MITATFYCNIIDPSGYIAEPDFDFDEGTFRNREELDDYIERNGYSIGEVCGYFGESIGVLTDIHYEGDDE